MANPDRLHTWPLETLPRLPEKRAFSKTEEREEEEKRNHSFVFEFAQASGQGFLEEFFSASESSSHPKSSSSWGGGERLPDARYWSCDSQASPPHPPGWGVRGPQVDSNPGRLKSSRLPAEELSLQLLTWGRGKPVSLISYGKS